MEETTETNWKLVSFILIDALVKRHPLPWRIDSEFGDWVIFDSNQMAVCRPCLLRDAVFVLGAVNERAKSNIARRVV